MNRWLLLICLSVAATLPGCAQSSPADEKAPAATTPESSEAPAAQEVEGQKVELNAKNTTIAFTGIHTGDKPDPRHGTFQRFTGTAVVDGTLKSVTVDIETESLTTEIEKLTNHLKNADFFDVKQFPRASFRSTSVTDTGDGTVNITGDLTLLENTHSITFPATVSTEGPLTLKADFKIDRTQWGMNYGIDKIEKEVPMSISIGG